MTTYYYPDLSYSYVDPSYTFIGITNWDVSWNSSDYNGTITIASTMGSSYVYYLSNGALNATGFTDTSLNNANSITTIYLPQKLQYVSSNAFTDLSYVSFFTYTDSSYSQFSSLPNTVTYVGSSAFVYCYSLTNFILPGSLIHIYNNSFSDCSSLSYIQILPSTSSTATLKIDNYAFQNCTALENVQILFINSTSNAVSIEIDYLAVQSSGNVFFNCDNIVYLLCCKYVMGDLRYYVYDFNAGIGANLTYEVYLFFALAPSPFYWTEINYYTYPDLSYNDPSFNGISNWNIYWDTTEGTTDTSYNGVIDISNNYPACTYIASNALNTSSISPQTTISTMNYEQITTIYLPSTTTTIGSYAFSGLTSLTSINLNDNITELNDYTFYNCYSLVLTSLPTNLTLIGNYTFYDCSNVSFTSWPSTLTSIGTGAFYNCSSLTSITIPATITEINLYTFGNCTSLATLEILGSSVTIDSSSNDSANPFYNTSITYLLCTNSSGTYTYELTIGTDPTTIIQTFYNSSSAPLGWISTTGYSYPKYVYSDEYGGSGMSFTTSYNSTDASNTYISSTYGNVVINALDASNSIYLGCTDCSSNVNNNLGNTINDVYVGGNLTVDSSLNVGGNLTVDGSLNVGGYITFGGGTPFMKIQYGTIFIEGYYNDYSAGTVTFNPSFSTVPVVTLSCESPSDYGNSWQNVVSTSNLSNTGFNIKGFYITNGVINNYCGTNVYWIAIGN